MEGFLMLRRVNGLRGLALRAVDDPIGSVAAFCFDDQSWSMRYMLVQTGNWLDGETVLISPRAIRAVDWARQRIDLNVTSRQIRDAPRTLVDQPISRRMELAHATYYNDEPYWYGPGRWGHTGFPYYGDGMTGYTPASTAATERERELPSGDTHLHSTREVLNYHIRASDGTLGYLSDFVMDDETWAVRYLVIDTRSRRPSKPALIAPAWIAAVSWGDRTIDVDLPGGLIRAAPAYDPTWLNRTFEQGLYRHYQRSAYWDTEGMFS
jgi:hypothetical protein